jgi:hypothetical protein
MALQPHQHMDNLIGGASTILAVTYGVEYLADMGSQPSTSPVAMRRCKLLFPSVGRGTPGRVVS